MDSVGQHSPGVLKGRSRIPAISRSKEQVLSKTFGPESLENGCITLAQTGQWSD